MSKMAGETKTIVQYYGSHEDYRCGYCKSPDTQYSHGMWAYTMNVQDYEDLINRGWRRSGKYCYKPTMNRTCCPMYTIRCLATEVKLSKSQKSVLKKVHRYLTNGSLKAEPTESICSEESLCTEEIGDTVHMDLDALSKMAASVAQKLGIKSTSKDFSKGEGLDEQFENVNQPNPVVLSSSASAIGAGEQNITDRVQPAPIKGTSEVKLQPKTGSGPDPLKPPCKKAKLLRLERKQEKLKMKGEKSTVMEIKKQTSATLSKSLEDYLTEPSVENPAHKLEIRLVQSEPKSKEFLDSFEESYCVYQKYQVTIHQDPPKKCSKNQYTRFLVDSPLKIRLVNTQMPVFKTTFDESYLLYKKYQIIIHKDPPEECDRHTYQNFLVDSPLKFWSPSNGPDCGYGSFHQQYWLDGKLIAVGVIDILPHCLSSVYFYYDPDYSFLSLGTYASLREIAFTRELQKSCPNLSNYYLGFYIHSCPKMRYKGQYYPSYLLCPETYSWHPIEKCRPLLEESKYSRFEEKNKVDENGKIKVGDVLVLYEHTMMSYNHYCHIKKKHDDIDEVKEYAKLAGRKCAEKLLLYRP